MTKANAIRGMVLVASVLLCAASGSSQPKYSNNSGGTANTASGSSGASNDNWSYFKISLDDTTDVIPLFIQGGNKISCQVAQGDKPNQMAAKCPKGTIVIIQDGKDLAFGCPDISEEQCRAIALEMMEAVKNG